MRQVLRIPEWFRAPRTFRARVFWSFIPIILLLFALVAVLTVQQQRRLIEREFVKRGEEMAMSLSRATELGVLAENERLLKSSLRGVASKADVSYVPIYTETGTLLASGGRQASAVDRENWKLSANERVRVLEDRKPVSRDVVVDGERSQEFVAPIFSESYEEVPGLPQGELMIGFVRLGLSLRPVEALVLALVKFWGAIAGLFFIATAVVIYAFSGRITRPIKRLTTQAKRIAAGFLDERIPVTSRDEVGQLAKAFNEMGRALKGNIEEKERILVEVKDLNRTLEDRGVELEQQAEALQQSLQEVRGMGEIIRAVNSSLALSEVLNTVAREAVSVSRADACGIFEFDLGRGTARSVAARGLSERFIQAVQDASANVHKLIIDRMGAGAGPVQIPDLTQAAGTELQAAAVAEGFRALLAVPIESKRVFRAIVLFRRMAGEFDARVVEIVTTLADQSKVAVEKARLFEELEEKGQQIEIANRHKSEFLANMSHELRTPLNAIIGFSEVLLEKVFGELGGKQEEYLNDIFSSGHHLLSLINDILDLSKIEAGKMEVELGEFDLPTALDNAVTLVRQRAISHEIELTVDFDSRLGTFTADERKVKQVLVNLLSNAIKFTPAGGKVAVRASLGDGAVEISVTDTGTGIAAEDQESIFEEFRQAGASYDQKHEGTGLGLTLARKFVDLHSGRIWVESERGVGSKFSFTLPIRSLDSSVDGSHNEASSVS